ncbi:MAG: type II secretion system minor pseudopilin GspH [Succinivibrionaceae bacterium]
MKLRITLNRGFTLIEIIVAVCIVGLIINMATLSVPSGVYSDYTPEAEAERLSKIIQEIEDRASMEGRIIGLHLENNGYKFVIRNKNTKKKLSINDENKFKTTDWDIQDWVTYQNDNIITERNFEDNLELYAEIGNLEILSPDRSMNSINFNMESHKARNSDPHILFYPSGETTPFKITFIDTDNDNKNKVTIIGNELGEIKELE